MEPNVALTAEGIEAAEQRIRSHVRDTPVERAPYLETLTGAQVFLKLENMQVTGSFKIRGAVHKLLQLGPVARRGGVVAASSGNHGVAVAHGANVLDCAATVFVPEGASPAKIATMRQLGADVRIHGDDCVRAEAEARTFAEASSLPYLSPYNDIDVAAGQGSIAVELTRKLDALDAIFVSLGGGGLIAGIGTYLRHAWPGVRVIACSPERSPAMHVCLEHEEIRDVPCHDTLSDGTAGGVEPGAITFPICKRVIDESILVSEDEIKSAMVRFIEHQHHLLEGAAGVALAGLEKLGKTMSGKRVGVVVCGTNISLATLIEVLR